ncbi:MAG: 30S ribosomal protein S12 methylthiotransferase RimO [Acutalibacteraceae bacterium]|nr:30S ribosomal protein S12 methylthiotransferase RimO [Acutalibacteraceae bacterium]
MSIKVAMVSLGCPKNQVDAEQMLYTLKQDGYTLVSEEAEAEVIIINTCGFIEDAKSEAIENIIEAARYKQEGKLKLLVVTGCLAERYRDDITEEIPEVDMVVGIGSNGKIGELIKSALKGDKKNSYGEKFSLDLDGKRVLGGMPYTAYIKIADGCDNCCTYCAIPQIRGRFRSRTEESIVEEAKYLAKNGVTELIVVAQDTTAYGIDIYGEYRLPSLLKKLCKVDGIHWIRTLYTYPEKITDELLYAIRDEEKLVPYLDIPIQHCNDEILKKMNRKGTKADIEKTLTKIREIVPDITLRTTFITGFPGETKEQYEELCEFIGKWKFDRLGCFAYSEEEDTLAATMKDQVPKQTRIDRAEHIMEEQLLIARAKNEQKIDTDTEVLIEGYDNFIRCYYGRSVADAPDVDGKIFFLVDAPQHIGEYVMVHINDCIEYDLLGEMIYESAE